MDINLKLRSKILEYSLFIENAINDLLKLYLNIDLNKNTRLFSHNPKITFKNKIDLLYDLEILSKEENFNFELLMIFRNKFLHDIECSSFQDTFKQTDNGIKNRFKNFLNYGENLDDEPACIEAMGKLFKSNLLVLRQKLASRKQRIQSIADIFKLFNEQSEIQVDVFFNFIDDLIQLLIIEIDETGNSTKLLNNILLLCENASKHGYQENIRLKEIFEKQSSLLTNKLNHKDIFENSNCNKIQSQIDELKNKIELNINREIEAKGSQIVK